MRKPSTIAIVLGAVPLACLTGLCFLPRPNAAAADAKADTPVAVAGLMGAPIQPIPEPTGLDPRKTALGRQLFFDVRLSHDNTISCASCHGLDKAGTDNLPHSIGIGGAVGAVNAPTVLNSGLNFRQFWNGRADTLEDQVNGPTHNPKEMGSDWDEIMRKLRRDPAYRTEFAAIYPDGIHPHNVRDAIATFERSLNTPDCRFDLYLRGDRSALDAVEMRGWLLFQRDGCVSCHQGVNMGGNMFEKFGVMGDYFRDRGDPTEADLGRYAVTGRERDRYVFRVPSLRNVALTAPYFHDGSATTLPQAVEVMAKYQLGRPLETDDLVAITRFLCTLTGRQPKGGAQ